MGSAADDLTQGPDGSPVWVFAALPAGRDREVLESVIPAGATVLDLGCGTGRLANPLAASGRRVTGVDLSEAMLEGLAPGVEAVHADIETLDLGRRFDAVVLAGNLVNMTRAGLRATLLATCRRHVDDAGIVLLQRLDPVWKPELGEHVSMIGDIRCTLRVEVVVGPRFRGSATYEQGDRSSTQDLDFEVLDDETLAQAVKDAGLRITGWADWQRWALARPTRT